MSFPWLHEANFETGDVSEWDGGETDTDGKLDVRRYDTLAGLLDLPDAIPYRGAFAMHIDLSGGTADAFVQEDTAYDTAASGTIAVRFYIYVSSGLTMADTDRFTVLALQSAGPTDEVVVDVRNNSGQIEILAAETGAAGTFRSTDLILDQWHAVEVLATIDAGGANDGTIDFFVDGRQVGAQLTGLDQGVIIQARLGAIGIEAGTTAGHLLFDQVVADSARVFPIKKRYDRVMTITKSGHVAVGPGRVIEATLISGGAADNQMALHDTDEGNVSDENSFLVPLMRNQNALGEKTWQMADSYGETFDRGLYVQLSGTNPRAQVKLDEALTSAGAIRNYARRRPIHGAV